MIQRQLLGCIRALGERELRPPGTFHGRATQLSRGSLCLERAYITAPGARVDSVRATLLCGWSCYLRRQHVSPHQRRLGRLLLRPGVSVALGQAAGVSCPGGANGSLLAIPFSDTTGSTPSPAPTSTPSAAVTPTPNPTLYTQNNYHLPPANGDYLFVR